MITAQTIGTTPNAIRYANGYYDTSTNLYKYGARYYNPSDARWTQLDPSGQDFGYLYAGNNPVNFVDPSGLAPNAVACVAAGISFLGASLSAVGSFYGFISTPATGPLGLAAGYGFAGSAISAYGAGIGLGVACVND